MYNPKDLGNKGFIFGIPCQHDEADIILIPVHLDVTVSYNEGTAHAPDLILKESSQLDLSIPAINKPWELKLAINERIVAKNENSFYRKKAKHIITCMEEGEVMSGHVDLVKVNQFCRSMHQKIELKCDELIARGKLIGIIGGDHSSPYGLIKSLSKTHDFGVLQIDAHMDLRKAYQSFHHSHASIMRNIILLDGIKSLTQVGIRDYAEAEELYILRNKKKINVFYDEKLFGNKMEGYLWSQQVTTIINTLPEKVYISFDIDGLQTSLCPNTGCPVPGGLTFNEVIYLIEQVARSGRKIIGFDVCEVGKGQWDANVGARIIYRLITIMGVSQKLLKFK